MKRIMLVGDSISLDYGVYLEKYTGRNICLLRRDGIAEAYKNLDKPIGGNGGDSGRVLTLAEKMINRDDFDIFVFNCGLHDIKRARPKENLQIGREDYCNNLQKIINIMKKKDVDIIFINTTPADETRYSPEAEFTRYASDVVEYNQIAEDVMQKNGVKIIDLYSFTMSLGVSGDELFRDHTHFKPDIIRQHAAFIAGALTFYSSSL